MSNPCFTFSAIVAHRIAQMTQPVTNIYMYREAQANADGSVLGKMRVGLHVFPTIERGNGYVSLKKGIYTMKHSIKNTGRKVKCLRPTNDKISTILVHDAQNDNSNNLSGCIAPGMEKKANGLGIRRSAEAMDLLWFLLGGWQQDKLVSFHVESNVPGDDRTKENWDRLK